MGKRWGRLDLTEYLKVDEDFDVRDFRKLAYPIKIMPATPRSQAFSLLALFGPMREEDLHRSGAWEETLSALEAEGCVERLTHKGTVWYQLTDVGDVVRRSE